jgi:hypothetical protein
VDVWRGSLHQSVYHAFAPAHAAAGSEPPPPWAHLPVRVCPLDASPVLSGHPSTRRSSIFFEPVFRDHGPKAGLNGVDNGQIWFHHKRVPRDALLDAFASVDADGTYRSPIRSPTARFGTMVSGLTTGEPRRSSSRVCLDVLSVCLSVWLAASLSVRLSVLSACGHVLRGPSAKRGSKGWWWLPRIDLFRRGRFLQGAC